MLLVWFKIKSASLLFVGSEHNLMFWVVHSLIINRESQVPVIFQRHLPKGCYFHRNFWYIRGAIKFCRKKLFKDFLPLGIRYLGENQLKFSEWCSGWYFLFASHEYNSLCLEIVSIIAFGARNWGLMTWL